MTSSGRVKARSNPRSGTVQVLALLALCAGVPSVRSEDFDTLCADRSAIERVYYSHRIGEKPPFEQVSPPALIETLVRRDLHKEAVLKKVYRVEITPAQVQAEVQRINATTRAPDTLAELKAALGDDTNRFARTIARPIVVERLLRAEFENDDALHAAGRREVERVREQLLAAKGKGESMTNLVLLLQRDRAGQFSETTWHFGSRRAPTNALGPNLAEIRKRFGPNAQSSSSPSDPAGESKHYFEDLPTDLQNVLRVQLTQDGDVSAVIETPGGFMVWLARSKTAEVLSTATLSVSKRSYEQWLNEINGSNP